MSWEPITRLVWTPHNRAKLRAREILQREVRELIALDEYVVTTHPVYPDQVRITGPTIAGRWLTVALAPLGQGVYRPVTGWKATARELAEWREVRRFGNGPEQL